MMKTRRGDSHPVMAAAVTKPLSAVVGAGVLMSGLEGTFRLVSRGGGGGGLIPAVVVCAQVRVILCIHTCKYLTPSLSPSPLLPLLSRPAPPPHPFWPPSLSEKCMRQCDEAIMDGIPPGAESSSLLMMLAARSSLQMLVSCFLMIEGWSVSTLSGLAVLGAVAMSGDGGGGGGEGGKPGAFKGKVVWITGASSGIGESMVRLHTCPRSHNENFCTCNSLPIVPREARNPHPGPSFAQISILTFWRIHLFRPQIYILATRSPRPTPKTKDGVPPFGHTTILISPSRLFLPSSGCTAAFLQALRFHRAGARVILSARRQTELERVKTMCLSQAGDALLEPVILPLDLARFVSNTTFSTTTTSSTTTNTTSTSTSSTSSSTTTTTTFFSSASSSSSSSDDGEDDGDDDAMLD